MKENPIQIDLAAGVPNQEDAQNNENNGYATSLYDELGGIDRIQAIVETLF